MLSSARRDPRLKAYLFPEKLGWQDGVINLPLILATCVALGDTNDWFADRRKINLLHEHKNFDPDWFDEAFNITIARCYSDGLLD